MNAIDVLIPVMNSREWDLQQKIMLSHSFILFGEHKRAVFGGLVPPKVLIDILVD